MTTLLAEIPDVDMFLGMPPEELAGVVLRVASKNLQQSGHVHLIALKEKIRGDQNFPGYERRIEEAELAFDEAWSWLVVQGLLIHPTDAINSGYVRLSRRAKTLLEATAFRNYANGVGFRQAFLHPKIAEEVWFDLSKGDYGMAVFRAFRAVEIELRERGKYDDADYGLALVRKAFHVHTGTLIDKNAMVSEREAELALFCGAMGIFKNPASHRNPSIESQRQAQEQVVLASLLLRILDRRSIA